MSRSDDDGERGELSDARNSHFQDIVARRLSRRSLLASLAAGSALAAAGGALPLRQTLAQGGSTLAFKSLAPKIEAGHQVAEGYKADLVIRWGDPVAKGAGPFYFPDGRARFNVAEYRSPVDDAGDEFPIYLTTGRVVSQFLSGTQTRRIGPLVRQYAEPRIEMHPRLAARLGIADGEWATAETRRGTITLRAQVVTTIRPDTIFIPYHWAGRKSANQLTVAAQDPISKIPQYKVCGCRVRRAEAPPEYASVLEPQQ